MKFIENPCFAKVYYFALIGQINCCFFSQHNYQQPNFLIWLDLRFVRRFLYFCTRINKEYYGKKEENRE